ncbi:hypothetical protein, partial [Lysinibacillus sp. fls2-241-R2A-57]|uniref:hypothetical protein n=1 Tax=Lysinibacillus sp. fls2-241-R2A-57 TaxID=3040292 RepID=UPI0025545226
FFNLSPNFRKISTSTFMQRYLTALIVCVPSLGQRDISKVIFCDENGEVAERQLQKSLSSCPFRGATFLEVC